MNTILSKKETMVYGNIEVMADVIGGNKPYDILLKGGIMGSEWIYLTNLRFDISNKLYLSKYFNFYLRNLNSEEENFFFEILKNEYKK